MRTLSRWLLCALAAATPAVAQVEGEKYDAGMRQATEVARQAVTTFARLVDDKNARALGFETPAELRAATLGAPSRGFAVRLDELKQYAGGDPARLLHSTDRLTFPLMLGGRTVSSVSVTTRDGGWAAESFGAPSYARLLSEARTRLGESAGRDPAETFEVAVPALNVRLVGTQSASGLLLASIVDDPRFGFRRGEALPAAEALGKLVPAAKEHNGLPT